MKRIRRFRRLTQIYSKKTALICEICGYLLCFLAIDNIFIKGFNGLGTFESDLTAGLFGPVASVVEGGFGTLLAVGAVAMIWPQLRRFGSFESAIASAAIPAEVKAE